MHESALAFGILEIVLDNARRAGARRVSRVDVCLGEYAGVEPGTLSACFEVVALGTLAEQAVLAVERIAATGHCEACGARAVKRGKLLRCPECEKSSVSLASGREFYVKSIEVESS